MGSGFAVARSVDVQSELVDTIAVGRYTEVQQKYLVGGLYACLKG